MANRGIPIVDVRAVPEPAVLLHHYNKLLETWHTWEAVSDETALRELPDVSERQPWVPFFHTYLWEGRGEDGFDAEELLRDLAYRIAVLERVRAELANHGVDPKQCVWWVGKSVRLDQILREGQDLLWPRELLERWPQSAYELAAFDTAVDAFRLSPLHVPPNELLADIDMNDEQLEHHSTLLDIARETLARQFRAKGMCIEPAGFGEICVKYATSGLRPEDVLRSRGWAPFQYDLDGAFVGGEKGWEVIELMAGPYPDLLVAHHLEMVDINYEESEESGDPFYFHRECKVVLKAKLRQQGQRQEALACIVKLHAPHLGGGRTQKPKPRVKRPQIPVRNDYPRLHL